MKYKRLNKLEILQCKNDYINGKSITEISKKMGVTSASICNHLDKFLDIKRTTHIVSKRKYSLDEFYFKDIDTERKAYFLGFLIADGYHNAKIHNIKLEIQERDGYILDVLSSELKCNKPIILIKKPTKNHQNRLKFSIGSSRMSTHLLSHGIVQNKSLIVKFPKHINEQLIRHLIRGIFDGDGSITNYVIGEPNRVCSMSICGTFDVCDNIKQHLEDRLKIKANVYKTKNIFAMYVGGRLQVSKVYDYLYNEASVYLIRKKERFEKWKNHKRLSTMKNNPARSKAAILNGKKYKKPTLQFDIDGNFIAEYDGIIDAAVAIGNVNAKYGIAMCCRNKIKSSRGFIWKYKSDDILY